MRRYGRQTIATSWRATYQRLASSQMACFACTASTTRKTCGGWHKRALRASCVEVGLSSPHSPPVKCCRCTAQLTAHLEVLLNLPHVRSAVLLEIVGDRFIIQLTDTAMAGICGIKTSLGAEADHPDKCQVCVSTSRQRPSGVSQTAQDVLWSIKKWSMFANNC